MTGHGRMDEELCVFKQVVFLVTMSWLVKLSEWDSVPAVALPYAHALYT